MALGAGRLVASRVGIEAGPGPHAGPSSAPALRLAPSLAGLRLLLLCRQLAEESGASSAKHSSKGSLGASRPKRKDDTRWSGSGQLTGGVYRKDIVGDTRGCSPRAEPQDPGGLPLSLPEDQGRDLGPGVLGSWGGTHRPTVRTAGGQGLGWEGWGSITCCQSPGSMDNGCCLSRFEDSGPVGPPPAMGESAS